MSSEKRSYTSSDRDYINPETIDLYCNTNAHLLTTPPRAFVLEFPGLGGGSCLGGSMDIAPYNGPLSAVFAENGILQAYAFPGPWSWMNRGAVRMINALVDAGFIVEKLIEPIPTVELMEQFPDHADLLHKPDFLVVRVRKDVKCL